MHNLNVKCNSMFFNCSKIPWNFRNLLTIFPGGVGGLAPSVTVPMPRFGRASEAGTPDGARLAGDVVAIFQNDGAGVTLRAAADELSFGGAPSSAKKIRAQQAGDDAAGPRDDHVDLRRPLRALLTNVRTWPSRTRSSWPMRPRI